MSGRASIRLTINGTAMELGCPPERILLDLLREDLNLTGTKRGCDLGTCGCCTVLLDGRPVLSCLTLARLAIGHDVTTIEGVTPATGLSPLQKAFVEHGATQCGFCTPGFIMMTRELLDRIPDPSDDDIRHYLSGNLCRCAAYPEIINAVRAAARDRATTKA